MRHKPFKTATEFVLCGLSIAGHGFCLKMWFISETPWEKTKFSFVSSYQWGWCFLLSPHWKPTWLRPVHSVPGCEFSVCQSGCGFLGVFYPTGSDNLLPPLPQSSLSPEWRELNGSIPFRTGCSNVSHSLQTVTLWVSVFVPTNFRRKILWGWLNEAEIYEYRRMLGATLLIRSFSRTLVFGFLLSPFLISRSWPPGQCWGRVPSISWSGL